MSRRHFKAAVDADCLAKALSTVLDYLWDAEKSDWCSLSPGERRHHIFHSLQTIQQWLDERGQ